MCVCFTVLGDAGRLVCVGKVVAGRAKLATGRGEVGRGLLLYIVSILQRTLSGKARVSAAGFSCAEQACITCHSLCLVLSLPTTAVEPCDRC